MKNLKNFLEGLNFALQFSLLILSILVIAPEEHLSPKILWSLAFGLSILYFIVQRITFHWYSNLQKENNKGRLAELGLTIMNKAGDSLMFTKYRSIKVVAKSRLYGSFMGILLAIGSGITLEIKEFIVFNIVLFIVSAILLIIKVVISSDAASRNF